MLQKTNTFQSFQKTPFKGIDSRFPLRVGMRGDLKALDKLFSINSFA